MIVEFKGKEIDFNEVVDVFDEHGPYCKEGEWIIMRSYSGTRFKVHGKEFRLINDDSVEAVVEDPRGIVKVI